MAKIEDLLHRRTDLSTFLVHLTRDTSKRTARDNLLSIAEDINIEARTPLGPAAHLEQYFGGSIVTQKVVCFTETPLEHTWMMLQDIEGRSIKLSSYGLAITKTSARKDHFNPVWYSDISTRGGRDWPMASINALIRDAVARATSEQGEVNKEQLREEPIFALTPFFEQMGPTNHGLRKEFWWEREWRHVGDYTLSFPSRIVAIFAPEHDHDSLRTELAERNDIWRKQDRPILDPNWGLERMIARLSGLSDKFVGPFPDGL